MCEDVCGASAPYNNLVQLRQALHARPSLNSKPPPSTRPRLHAEVLVFHVLGCDRAYLFAHPERELTPDEQSQYEAAHLPPRRWRALAVPHRPSGVLEGSTSSSPRPCSFPRPETEHLIEEVLALVQPGVRDRQRSVTRPALTPHLKLIDVGTGSGAIAITLARELPEAEVHAVDLSPAALEVARRNAERLGARVHFAQSDVLFSVLANDDLAMMPASTSSSPIRPTSGSTSRQGAGGGQALRAADGGLRRRRRPRRHPPAHSAGLPRHCVPAAGCSWRLATPSRRGSWRYSPPGTTSTASPTSPESRASSPPASLFRPRHLNQHMIGCPSVFNSRSLGI